MLLTLLLLIFTVLLLIITSVLIGVRVIRHLTAGMDVSYGRVLNAVGAHANAFTASCESDTRFPSLLSSDWTSPFPSVQIIPLTAYL